MAQTRAQHQKEKESTTLVSPVGEQDSNPHQTDPSLHSDTNKDGSSSLESANTENLSELWQRQDLINNRNALSLKRLERTTQDLSTTTLTLTKHSLETTEKLDCMQEMMEKNFSEPKEIKNQRLPEQGFKLAINRSSSLPQNSFHSHRSNIYVPPLNRSPILPRPDSFTLDHSPSRHSNASPHHSKDMVKLDIKIDFPTFSGEDRVIDWLRQVEQFFKCNHTDIQEWVHICSFHLKK